MPRRNADKFARFAEELKKIDEEAGETGSTTNLISFFKEPISSKNISMIFEYVKAR